jgi:hypothetical protein
MTLHVRNNLKIWEFGNLKMETEVRRPKFLNARHLPRGNYSGRETPLPLRGISPKGQLFWEGNPSAAARHLPQGAIILGGKPLCRCAASPQGAIILGGKPLCRCAASPPRGNYSGRETPLPLRGISPKGEIISYYLVELHSVAEHSPPGGNKRG